MAGQLLPQASGRVRRTTDYVDLTLVHDVAAAVRRQDPRPGSVVVVDGLETVGTSDEQAAVSELIKRIAVMRGLIPDPYESQPSGLEAEVEHLVEAIKKD